MIALLTVLPVEEPLDQLVRLVLPGHRYRLVLVSKKVIESADDALGADLSVDAFLNGVANTVEHQHV